jgi:hypothetical protein
MPFSDAMVYQIRVQGWFDESWSDWLGGLTITPQLNGETLLRGSISDQAALHGLLDRLCAMNLTILLVAQINTESDNRGDRDGIDNPN